MNGAPCRAHLWRRLASLALATAAVALALPAGAMAAETGVLEGTVTLEGGGPVEGAGVCALAVVPGAGEEAPCVKTGEGGGYEIAGLAPGEYEVEFRPVEGSGYLLQYYDDAASRKEAARILVGTGVLEDIDAELEKGATIGGTVTAAATGLPVAGVKVCGRALEEEPPTPCVKTDALGDYTLTGVGAGAWEVDFRPEALLLGLLAQTYDGRAFGEEPTAIHVAAHEEVGGIDAALVPGGAVQGTVRLAATAGPLSGIEVCLTEVADPFTPTCVKTGASGRYRIFGLPTAAYKVVFSPTLLELHPPAVVRMIEEKESAAELAPWNDAYPSQWWNRQPSFATATPIPVTAPATVEGIDGLLGPPPVPAPVVLPPPAPTPPKKKKPLRCRHGRVKRKIHGKLRCVKRRHGRHHKKSKSR